VTPKPTSVYDSFLSVPSSSPAAGNAAGVTPLTGASRATTARSCRKPAEAEADAGLRHERGEDDQQRDERNRAELDQNGHLLRRG